MQQKEATSKEQLEALFDKASQGHWAPVWGLWQGEAKGWREKAYSHIPQSLCTKKDWNAEVLSFLGPFLLCERLASYA